MKTISGVGFELYLEKDITLNRVRGVGFTLDRCVSGRQVTNIALSRSDRPRLHGWAF